MKPGETYEKYDERFTKQQEMWKFQRYLDLKKEDQQEFTKFDWKELEIKKKIIHQNLKKLCRFQINVQIQKQIQKTKQETQNVKLHN